MVDFAEALKARIKGMSPDELAATETRRLSREVDESGLPSLEAIFEPILGDKGQPEIKPVTMRIDTDPSASQDVLKASHGTAFLEALLLTPQTYRAIAGGHVGASRSTAPPERFIINPGRAGQDKVSVQREDLVDFMKRERPGEIARALRLVSLEQHAPSTMRLSVERREALFARRWLTEIIGSRVDGILSKVSSRTILLMAGRDHVAFWVRLDDDVEALARLFEPDMVAAIVAPPSQRLRHSPIFPMARAAETPLHRHTYPGGKERVLLLDLTVLRKAICAMTAETDQRQAMVLLEHLADKAQTISGERLARRRPIARSRPAPRATTPEAPPLLKRAAD